MLNQDQDQNLVTALVSDFTKLIINLFNIQNHLMSLDLSYDEDLICSLKDEFINRYRLVLTIKQIEDIYSI
jgi:hypothetical protein